MNETQNKHMQEIFEHYHTESFEEWPALEQIALDIGWLTAMIATLKYELESERRRQTNRKMFWLSRDN